MKFKIFNQNNDLYFIPIGLILLNMLLRFFGVELPLWAAMLCVISIFAVLAYNFTPTGIFLNEKELRIHHIFVRKIGIDAIDRVHLEEYIKRFKGMRTNRLRLMIVYRSNGETRELYLNDTKAQHTLVGTLNGKSSALYDIHNYLKSYISKEKAADYSEQ
ncbi:MAG: hypothetical protein ACI4KM_01160 [Oscillospiraceae bacterium]